MSLSWAGIKPSSLVREGWRQWGTIGRKVLWPFWLNLWACRVEQAGPWEVLRGTLHLLHASGPCTTPVRGCGGPECRVSLVHVELPVEMEVTQTENVPGVGKRGLGMVRLRNGYLALPGPPWPSCRSTLLPSIYWLSFQAPPCGHLFQQILWRLSAAWTTPGPNSDHPEVSPWSVTWKLSLSDPWGDFWLLLRCRNL